MVRLAPQAQTAAGNDYVLIGRRAALNLPFDRLAEDFSARLAACTLPDAEGSGRLQGPSATPHAGTR